MSESDESGMGIVRRRRSRRLLETRTAASKAGEAQITSESAAAAWGDILSGNGGLPDEVFHDVSTPPPARQPEPSPRIVEIQSDRVEPDEFSRPVRGRAAQSAARIVEPSGGPIEAKMPSSAPPKAQLRGVPLSNRPGAVAPPDEEARAARISEVPRKRNSQLIALNTSNPITPPVDTDSTADFEGDNSLLREALRATQPKAALTTNAVPSTLEFEVATDTLDLEGSVDTQKVELVVSRPPRGKRTLAVIGVLLLFIGACVWSAAILFDEMERSARLNRVADALDGRVARIVEETPLLTEWVKGRDAAMLQSLSDKELPIFRETLTATGYAEGIPKVKMLPDSTSGRMIFEVALPDSTLALDSNGDWMKGPPKKGFGAALQTNMVPVVVGFAIPTLAAITLLVATRRRRTA